jgi:uncharacterized repeat protein (TIGR03943 family)
VWGALLAPWLLITGLLLCGLGALGLAADFRPSTDRADPDEDHAVPGVAWLLMTPIVLLVLVAPPALGSYGVRGVTTRVAAPAGALRALPPPRDGAVELTLREYAQRVLFDRPAALDGTRLRLVGFVVPATATERRRLGAGFFLTRITLSCCAADGQPARVYIQTSQPQRADSWLAVEGHAATTPARQSRADADDDVVLVSDVIRPIQQPLNPYSR